MAISGAATQSAATQSAQPYITAVDALNDPVGYPAQERYPGAVDPGAYGTGHIYAPVEGGPSGPVTGDAGTEPFTSTLPHQAPGGGFMDYSWTSGHDGPSIDWDSSAGAPFAPSGAINPDLHGTDTGGVHNKEHVVPAAIGKLTRRTSMGQTTVKQSGDQETRDNQTQPNNRMDLDQYQDWNPDGYDPWLIPYSERPIFNNLAYQQAGTQDTGTQYGVSGALPDRSPYDYAAQAYQAPADPAVQSPVPANANGIGEGWVL